jgi:WD40 repeat protein
VAPLIRCRLAAVLAAVLAAPALWAAPPAANRPRLDGDGDPLPEGALARLGSQRFRVNRRISAVALSPQGDTLAVGWSGGITLLDAQTGKELRLLGSANDGPSVLRFLDDGKVLAARRYEGIELWDAATGRSLRQMRFRGWDFASPQPSFSADGKWLAMPRTAGRKPTLEVLEVATGKSRSDFEPLPNHEVSSALSSDGCLLAGWGLNDVPSPRFAFQPAPVVIWDVRTGKAKQEIRPDGASPVQSAAFSPDGTHLAVAGGNRVIVYAVGTGQQVVSLAGEHGMGDALTWSADGKHLAVASLKGTVRAWQVATGKSLAVLPIPLGRAAGRHAVALACTPGGRVLAAARRGHSACVWDVLAAKRIGREAGHTSAVLTVGFTPDGQTVVSADNETIRFWGLAGGKQTREVALTGRPMPVVLGAVLSPDGRYLCSNEWIRVRLLESATGRELHTLLAPGTNSIQQQGMFTADGTRVAVVGEEAAARKRVRVVHVWDLAAGRPRSLAGLKTDANRWRCAALSPDGKHLAVAQHSLGVGKAALSCEVLLWDVAADREVRKLSHGAWVEQMAFAPHGRLLAGADRQGMVHLWSTWTGKVVRSFRLPDRRATSNLAFSPDGRTLAVGLVRAPGQEGVVQGWEVLTGLLRQQGIGHRGAVLSVAFAPDGRTLASAGESTTVLLWDAGGQAGGGSELKSAELEALWAGLGKLDGVAAFRAIGRLAAAPRSAVPFLRERARPARRQAVDAAKVPRWIGQLDDDDFTTREKASRELERAGAAVRPALEKALAGKPPLEKQRRLEALLGRLDKGDNEAALVRELRAVEALERMGTAEARGLLEALAKGEETSPLTRDAGEALARLRARAGKR